MNKITILTAVLMSSAAVAKDTVSLSAFDQFILDTDLNIEKPNLSANKGITIVTVGNDVTCDYQNEPIQDAIDDGFIHIRVVEGVYTENLNIDDTDMTIEGGYADCPSAVNDDLSGGGSTAISGSDDPTSSVITIPNSADAHDIILRRLSIRNGGQSTLAFGGGISILNSPSNVTVQNSIISNNSANFGGGISIILGTPNVIIQDTFIANNTGQSGGGISCVAPDGAQVNFFDTGSAATGGIFNNTATTRNGGGVELSSGCSFVLYSGQDPNNAIDFRGIISNTARENGGGVSVSGGSSFTAAGFQFLAGNNVAPATIRNNNADSNMDETGNGGGVYVEGENSIANLFNVNMQDNIAYDGGAVSAENGAVVTTESINFVVPCWSPGKCNRFQGNTARRYGGVFYTDQTEDLGTAINVYSSQIYNNESNSTGGVSYISGADSTFLMEGSVVYQNTANVILYNFTDASATYQYNTIADNDASLSILRNFQGNISLTGSIVHNTNANPVYSTTSPDSESFDCLITHENASFPGNIATPVADPRFIDRNNNDYHIDAFLSPAVDFCAGAANPPLRPNDIDNEPRGWDDYIAGDEFGPYDLGADETYENDVIFKDNIDG